jgi:hypothetical protein
MTFNKYSSISIKEVENGFVVRHENGYLNSKEFITVTFEEAKNTAMRLLTATSETQEEITDEL